MRAPRDSARHAGVLAALALAACAPAGPSLPWAAEPMPAAPTPATGPATPEQVELGRLLFHDPVMSSDRLVACVTCHGQVWGLSDGLPQSIGVGGVGPAGTGRTGPTHTRRNAQTIWNAAYRETLFHDGRAGSLEAQVLVPLEDITELGRDPGELEAELRTIPAYVALFAAAFPDEAEPVSTLIAARAIAAFERTLLSDNAPYDQYLRGDERALSEGARQGMFLFADAGCADCHAPPLFESARFENVGVPPLDGIEDRGRAEVTGDPADEGRFRVPTLRNLRETAPYLHTGAAPTMEDAIRSHRAALGGTALGGTALQDDEVAAIVLFLSKALTDKSREPRRPLTVPSGLEVPVDGYRVPR